MQVWTAADRDRSGFVATQIGLIIPETARKIWNKVKIHRLKFVCTDGNLLYSGMISNHNRKIKDNARKIRHIIRKTETCLVESYNAFYGIIWLD